MPEQNTPPAGEDVQPLDGLWAMVRSAIVRSDGGSLTHRQLDSITDAIVADLGIRHVGWYYHYEPASEHHWSSNIAVPPSHDGVSDVRPMFATVVFGSRDGGSDA